jgi:hypothetical protein
VQRKAEGATRMPLRTVGSLQKGQLSGWVLGLKLWGQVVLVELESGLVLQKQPS